MRLALSGPEARVISVEHESKSGENGQRGKKSAQAAGKISSSLNGDIKTIAEP